MLIILHLVVLADGQVHSQPAVCVHGMERWARVPRLFALGHLPWPLALPGGTPIPTVDSVERRLPTEQRRPHRNFLARLPGPARALLVLSVGFRPRGGIGKEIVGR